MSKIKNGGLDQYGGEPFQQQQFGTGGAEGVNNYLEVVKSFEQEVQCAAISCNHESQTKMLCIINTVNT